MRVAVAVLVVLAGCSGSSEPGGPECLLVVWTDADGDGFGDPATEHVSCEGRPDEVQDATDCDDANADVNPGETEVCDGVDQNCDGTADEGLPTTRWHPDADGDGFGSLFQSFETCEEAPAGAVQDGSDCKDDDFDVNPDQREVCDGKDNDCDTRTDDEDPTLDLSTTTTFYQDQDDDGFGDDADYDRRCEDPAPGSTVTVGGDCDDTVATVNPDATEVCSAYDDDCDGLLDEDDDTLDATTITTWCRDQDGDGYGSSATSVDACRRPSNAFTNVCGDCDDANASVGGGC